MNELTTPNYVIVFHDDSTTQITEKQYNAIVGGEAKFIRLNGQLIARTSIAKILSLSDYYDQYPNKKPTVYEDKFKQYESIEQRAVSRPNWIKGIIKGIQQHIDEQGGAEHASKGSLELLTKWQKKLKLYE